MNRPRPIPPYPDLVRRPSGPFGWLDAHLLHEDWLVKAGPEATAVLVLLALAADRYGASFFSRDRMARALGLERRKIDRALARLVELGLVAHRPWRPDLVDGVWQLLPVPRRKPVSGPGPVAIREVISSLGYEA